MDTPTYSEDEALSLSDYPDYAPPPSVSSGGSFFQHLENVHQVFESFDNILSLHCFRNLIGAILPSEAVPPQDPEQLHDSEIRMIELFKVIDTDKDGLIQFQDFLDAQKPWREALLKKQERNSNISSAPSDLLDDEIDALEAMHLAVHITSDKVGRLCDLIHQMYPAVIQAPQDHGEYPIDLRLLRSKLLQDEAVEAHAVAPAPPPLPILSVIEFDFVMKKHGFELRPEVTLAEFSEMVATLEQEVLAQAQTISYDRSRSVSPTPVPSLDLFGKGLVTSPSPNTTPRAAKSGLPKSKPSTFKLNLPKQAFRDEDSRVKTSPRDRVHVSTNSGEEHSARPRQPKQFVFDEEQSALDLLETIEAQIESLGKKARQIQSKEETDGDRFSLFPKANDEFSSNSRNKSSVLELAAFQKDDSSRISTQLIKIIKKALGKAKKKVEKQNDEIFSLEQELEKGLEQRIQWRQAREEESKQFTELWERCGWLEKDRERLIEVLEITEASRRQLEEMFTQDKEQLKSVRRLQQLELERNQMQRQLKELSERNAVQNREIEILKIQLSRSHNRTPARTPSIIPQRIRETSEISETPISYDSKQTGSSQRFGRQDSQIKRKEAKEIAEAQSAELLNHDESYEEYEHAIASEAADGVKFSNRFQEFMAKYKGIIREEILEKALGTTDKSGKQKVLNAKGKKWSAELFFNQVKQDYQRVLQEWEATEAEVVEKAHDLQILEEKLRQMTKEAHEWQHKFKDLEFYMRQLPRPGEESLTTSLVSHKWQPGESLMDAVGAQKDSSFILQDLDSTANNNYFPFGRTPRASQVPPSPLNNNNTNLYFIPPITLASRAPTRAPSVIDKTVRYTSIHSESFGNKEVPSISSKTPPKSSSSVQDEEKSSEVNEEALATPAKQITFPNIKVSAPSRNQALQSHFSSPPQETKAIISDRDAGVHSYERTPEFALYRQSKVPFSRVNGSIPAFKHSPLSPSHRQILANFRPSSYSQSSIGIKPVSQPASPTNKRNLRIDTTNAGGSTSPDQKFFFSPSPRSYLQSRLFAIREESRTGSSRNTPLANSRTRGTGSLKLSLNPSQPPSLDHSLILPGVGVSKPTEETIRQEDQEDPSRFEASPRTLTAPQIHLTEASDPPFTGGRIAGSSRGDQFDALGQIDLSAINLNSSRLTFIEDSQLNPIKHENKSPRSPHILIRDQISGEEEGEKVEEYDANGYMTARFPERYDNSMSQEVAKREESMYKKRRQLSSKFSSAQKLKLNQTMGAQSPGVRRLKESRKPSESQNPTEHPSRSISFLSNRKSILSNRNSLINSRFASNENNADVHEQLRAFKENYEQLRASHARLLNNPQSSRIKILKFYQRAMLPLTRELQRRSSTRNFDFAHLGQALLSSPLTRDAFLADDEYHAQKSARPGGPPALTEEARTALYSEKIDYFRELKHRERRLLIIRGGFLYFYDIKNFKRITRVPLSHIHSIELIRKSAQLLLLGVEGYHPYLLQTLHRLELTVFLVDQRKRLKLPRLAPKFKERLHITQKGQLVDSLSPLESSVLGNLSSPDGSSPSPSTSPSIKKDSSGSQKLAKIISKFNFSNAERRGLLWVLRAPKNIFQSAKWVEKAVVLTGIGVLVFKHLQDQSPFFFPLINASVHFSSQQQLPSFPKELILSLKAALQKDNRERAIPRPPILQLRLLDLKPLTIAFPTSQERDRWADSLRELQKKYEQQEGELISLKT